MEGQGCAAAERPEGLWGASKMPQTHVTTIPFLLVEFSVQYTSHLLSIITLPFHYHSKHRFAAGFFKPQWDSFQATRYDLKLSQRNTFDLICWETGIFLDATEGGYFSLPSAWAARSKEGRDDTEDDRERMGFGWVGVWGTGVYMCEWCSATD